MYLKRLDLQGFKSFPEKVKLEFNPGGDGGCLPERERQEQCFRCGALGAWGAESQKPARR